MLKEVEPGWHRVSANQILPTFTTSHPSPVPGRKPAALELCSPDDITRWQEVRVPNVRERECILGFPLDCAAKCFPKSQQRNCRRTLLGTSWSVPVVCCLLHSLFPTLGLNTPMSMQDIVQRLTPGQGLVRKLL